jgi:pimeloyl-ACP methyl ester carboxylesterase
VRSLAVVEPVIPGAMTNPASVQYFIQTVGTAFGLYGSGDTAAAIDTFARGAFGPDYRGSLERVLPGAYDRAVADADALFRVELPSLQQWRFTREEAARVCQPVLSVYHHDPVWPGFRESHEVLTCWLPHAETLVVPVSTHLLPMVDPGGLAEGLVAFYTG